MKNKKYNKKYDKLNDIEVFRKKKKHFKIIIFETIMETYRTIMYNLHKIQYFV